MTDMWKVYHGTLACHPYPITRTYVTDQGSREVKEKISTAHVPEQPEVSLARLKALLKDSRYRQHEDDNMYFDEDVAQAEFYENRSARNNLEKVQSIALFNFAWPAPQDGNDSDSEDAYFHKRLEEEIKDGFQNLERLFLFYSNHGDDEQYIKLQNV
ncbi:hypothetical protein M7I_0606 [Glarea lozoyensis 74030]|uniref:Uncharacterized protein n=1 Tax=Glarea lozoyensis (strain ATCC 74030 / MF5533) TaxID=1104152 RepID=H0EDF8_GLAL7|nr:hypothetical protein M7I_0606 [Glarea lozoyensis 74030]